MKLSIVVKDWAPNPGNVTICSWERDPHRVGLNVHPQSHHEIRMAWDADTPEVWDLSTGDVDAEAASGGYWRCSRGGVSKRGLSTLMLSDPDYVRWMLRDRTVRGPIEKYENHVPSYAVDLIIQNLEGFRCVVANARLNLG